VAIALLCEEPDGKGIINKGDKEGNTALHLAAAEGHLAVVVVLMANGAQVDAKNDDKCTPMMNAALNGHKK
jgi:ankyrin repeat protein